MRRWSLAWVLDRTLLSPVGIACIALTYAAIAGYGFWHATSGILRLARDVLRHI